MNKLSRHLIFSWVLVLLSSFFLQVLTISFVPGIGQDEVQITDYGRLSIHPYSTWSMTWMIGENKPLLLWSYLGPLISEAAFYVGGPSGTGPRIASLIGGLAAGSVALGWLLSRNVPKYVAFFLGVAFLLDPLFNLSQRMGRSDSWVIALCLTACWLLRDAGSRPAKHANREIFLAGGFAAIAALVWPSAFLLYPLILFEFWTFSRLEANVRKRLFHVARFLFGGVMITILLLIPIREHLYIIFDDLKDMLTFNVDTSKSPLDKIASIFSLNNWLKLVKIFVKTFSPFLPLLALLSLIYRNQIGLKLITLLAILLIFITLVYELRLLYLLPYFLALGGGLFTRIAELPINKLRQRVCTFALFVIMGWPIVVTVLVRSGFAYTNREHHSRDKIGAVAESFVGPGDHRVFLGFTYEFYFAGRTLGWELYTPYIKWTYDRLGNWERQNDYQPEDKFVKLLSRMDYAIFPTSSISDDLSRQLSMAGLIYRRQISINDEKSEVTVSPEDRNKQILLAFLFGYKDYGPYFIYGRQREVKAHSHRSALNRSYAVNKYK